MALQFGKATRKKVFLKLNISAPSGAGKTMSALLMAYGMTNDWNKIGLIDTENGSGSLYEHLGAYNTVPLEPPFTPERYMEAMDLCVTNGCEVVIIDSSSHEWSGPGGCLEINEKLAAAKYRGNTWSAWNETTPRHDAFVQHLLQLKAHTIACTRSKMETIMGDDKKVKKVGMKDIQRDTWEYELTVSLSIDRDTHKAVASKDRTNVFEGKDPFIITAATGAAIKAWCETGVDEEVARKAEIQILIDTVNATKDFDVLEALKAATPTVIVSDGSFTDAFNNKYTVLLAEAAKVAAKTLKATKTLPDLQTAYLALPVPVRAKVTTVKDEMKIKLTPATTPAV